MSKIAVAVVISSLFLSLDRSASSADESVFSGPQVGESLPPLKVVLAYGAKKGDEVDLAAAANRRPSLLVIVSGANRPAARLTRVLMNYAEMCDSDRLSAALVWLDDDRSGAQRYLQQDGAVGSRSRCLRLDARTHDSLASS